MEIAIERVTDNLLNATVKHKSFTPTYTVVETFRTMGQQHVSLRSDLVPKGSVNYVGEDILTRNFVQVI